MSSVGGLREPLPGLGHGLLHLDKNEGGLSSTELLDDLRALGPELLRRYPAAEGLEATIARRLGVDAAQVLVTNGGDDGIDRVCRVWLGPGRELVVATPTFEMILAFARMCGATLVGPDVLWQDYPVDEVLDAVGPRTGVVAVVSPNNPTGSVASAADVLAVADGVPEGAVLLFDGAYVEFADHDPTPQLLERSNIVVCRTLSKAWGLAGLRVGYLVGPRSLIGRLREVGSPYPVATPSLALARMRLERDEVPVRESVLRIRYERSALEGLLTRLGGHPMPSQTNFVYSRFDDAEFVADSLAALGIRVRRWEHLPDALRIGCPGDEDDFARLCDALETVLAPEAVIFDLDGVLADVSGSYRRAIQETCAEFGTTVSAGDISGAKAAGGANDDWELTRTLLRVRGVEATLEEVKDRFERLYQGTDKQEGFRAAERLIASESWLASLGKTLPLAIVTGRPRQDAERFLGDQGILPLFQAVVCREDAALKPDPAPVRLALDRLGVSRAWMIGDTPDDIVSARAAGVLPIAVSAPGEQPSADVFFEAAGPARILDTVQALGDILPCRATKRI